MSTPFGTFATDSLPLAGEIAEILRNPEIDKVSILPPVKPTESSAFIFRADCGKKWWWRCDQYNWVNVGRRFLKGAGLFKTYFRTRTTECPKGDARFSKSEYSFPDDTANFVFVYYEGDHAIAEPLVHGLSKPGKSVPFIRNAPCVKPKILDSAVPRTTPKAVYDELTSKPAPDGLEAVEKPRSLEQVRNVVKVERRKGRLTHDALYNAYELYHQLPDFIRYYRLAPNLNVRILSGEMMTHFEDAVAAASPSNPVQVFVDTTFNLGDYLVTAILFRFPAFVGDPVVPLAFLYHEKRWRYDHQEFLSFFYKSCVEFQNRPEHVVIISDREFDFAQLFPNTKHVYCWLHLLENVQRWLEKRTAFTKDQRDQYMADVRKLMKSRSLGKYQKRYVKLKESWNDCFLQYFDKRIKIAIEERVGRWIVEPLGLYSPYSGITTNAIESFNAVIKQWQEWKQIPLDCSILALRRLVDYYGRMIKRGFYRIGDYQLKEGVLARGMPHQCPKREVIDVKQIIDVIRAETDNPKMVGDEDDEHQWEKQPTSVEACAREVIIKKQISYVQEQGCFVINGDEGIFTVSLGSPETCSCNGKNCYHIGAARLSVGKTATRGKKKPGNLAQRRRYRRRGRNEGKKAPSRDAYDCKIFLAPNKEESAAGRSLSQTPKRRRRYSSRSHESESTNQSQSSQLGKKRKFNSIDISFKKRKKLTPVNEDLEGSSRCSPTVDRPQDCGQDISDLFPGASTPEAVILKPPSKENLVQSPINFDAVPPMGQSPLHVTASSPMDKAIRALGNQFPSSYEQDAETKLEVLRPFVQLLQLPGSHWVCLKYDGAQSVMVYSSIAIDWKERKSYSFSEDARFIQLACAKKLGSLDHFSIIPVCKKLSDIDTADLVAVASAVDLCFENDPIDVKYHGRHDLEQHFLKCLQADEFEPFPSTMAKSKKDWKSKRIDISLYCYCKRPCIQPDLATVICCDSCKRWFHNICVSVPNEVWEDSSLEWQCPTCTDDRSKEIVLPRWGGEVKKGPKKIALVNTCTIDNFLAIMHYANIASDSSVCNQLLRSSGRYREVGKILCLMEQGKFAEAKYEWAKVIGIKPNYKIISLSESATGLEASAAINFYGTLQAFWLSTFDDLFSFTSCCSNRFCDLGHIKHTAKFSLTRFTKESVQNLGEVIQKYISEYADTCKELPSENGGTVCLTRNCDGVRKYSAKTWIAEPPFLSIDVQGIVDNADNLPHRLNILERLYRLIGVVLYRTGHFVGILIKSDGSRLYYDGLHPGGFVESAFIGTQLSCCVYLRE